MVEIGGMPILWHIMKIYAAHGVRDFIICLGYKGYLIKEFFVNFYHHTSDLTVDTGTGEISIHRRGEDSWRVTLVETGLNTMTGGRLKRIRDYVANDEAFFMTYGDGVASIDITALLAFHKAQGPGPGVLQGDGLLTFMKANPAAAFFPAAGPKAP
jgi:glucose-1-phosphate cytidylyltransferase